MRSQNKSTHSTVQVNCMTGCNKTELLPLKSMKLYDEHWALPCVDCLMVGV